MIYFLLPIYNESQNLEDLFTSLSNMASTLKQEYQIVAVNDASTDDSKEKILRLKNQFPIIDLHHETNQGPGAAFKTGFLYLLQKGKADDTIVTMDADNTHSPKTLSMMVTKMEEGYEVVIASIFAPGGMLIGLPFIRYLLTLACNLMYRIFFPVRGIREYTGFYRAYRIGILQNLYKTSNGKLYQASGFASMAELLITLRRLPAFMCEVPMIVRYDQKGGSSKMKVFDTIFEHISIVRHNFFKRRII